MTIEEAQRDVEAKEQALADAKEALERVKAQEPRYYRWNNIFYRVVGDSGIEVRETERSCYPVAFFHCSIFDTGFFGGEATEIPASEFHAAAREALAKITDALALPDTRKSPEEEADTYYRKWCHTRGVSPIATIAEILRREREEMTLSGKGMNEREEPAP